jgi:plasmid maintenance system antidote protein VapI|tara:strand:+ start:40 stop:900 length:861 start_codon:yes stop_codon:yes gene_type:complete
MAKKKKSKKKLKKQQAMKAAFADNKISKKEAKQLSKMGISQAKLQKNYNKQFKPGNFFSFDQSKTGTKADQLIYNDQPATPAYTPLQMGGAAMKMLGGIQQTAKPVAAPAAAAPVASGVQQVTQDSFTSPYKSQIDALLASMKDTQSSISQQNTGMEDLAKTFATKLAKVKTDSAAQLTTLQDQWAAQNKAAQESYQQAIADYTASTEASLAEQAQEMAKQQEAMKLAAKQAKQAEKVAMKNYAMSKASPTIQLGAQSGAKSFKKGIKAFMKPPTPFKPMLKGINL